jgi:hypothetical protein
MKLSKQLIAGIFTAGCSYALLTSYTGAGKQADNVNANGLSAVLPYDVTLRKTPPRILETTIRADFDLFSWESFVALNWRPDGKGVIGDRSDNPTVWETWKESYEIFLPDGKAPAPWGKGSFVPPACAKDKGTGLKLLAQVGKTPNVLDEMDQPFKTGPLIDQNGQYTRFEILVNREMFNYIEQNKLYSFDGQNQFKGKVVFPSGSINNKTYGAIMVKAAWKILGKGDDASRFHTAKALVYVPPTDDPVIRETCYVATVGLVGLHIGTKTDICPQWIWSTFEQVDNVPKYGNYSNNGHYNYFNPKQGYAEMNNAPARPWDPNIKGQKGSQIVRLNEIARGTDSLNMIFRKKLRAVNPKSVWQYYELVGTQWPVNPGQLPAGNPFPLFMANTTLESYIQGIVKDNKVQHIPGVSSSCMGCHNGATMKSTGQASDFTFLLERAQ